MADSERKKRRPRFSYEELEALVRAVQRHRTDIFKHSKDIKTCMDKNRVWDTVASAVNTVSEVKRDGGEVRRKWKDWQSIVKGKDLDRKRQEWTACEGQKMIKLSPAEEKVLAIIENTVEDASSNSSSPPPNTESLIEKETHEIDTPMKIEEPQKKKRRPRFSLEELDALVIAVQEHRFVVSNKHADVITSRDKNRAWDTITDAVNSVATVKRDTSEVRRKWKDWLSVIKAKEENRAKYQRKISSSPDTTKMTPLEKKVISLFGTETLDDVPNSSDSSTLQDDLLSKDTENQEKDKEEDEEEEEEGQQKKRKRDSSTTEETIAPTDLCETLHSDSEAEKDVPTYESDDNCVLQDEETPREMRQQQIFDSGISSSNLSSDMNLLLKVEQDRLQIESQRLEIERERLAIEKEKLELMKSIFCKNSTAVQIKSEPYSLLDM